MKAEKCLLCFYDSLKTLKTDYENLTQRKSIAWNFANEMLAVKTAEAEICKTYLIYGDYIPLKILAQESISSVEKFMQKKEIILENCKSNSDTANVLFQKRSKQIFEKAISKGESMRKEESLDKNFEKQLLLFCKLKKSLCSNFFRFETDEISETAVREIVFEERERFRKIDYLLKLR